MIVKFGTESISVNGIDRVVYNKPFYKISMVIPKFYSINEKKIIQGKSHLDKIVKNGGINN